MNAYGLLLFLHGAWRWAVLVSGLVVLARTFIGWRRGRAWSGTDDRWSRGFVSALDLQMLLGLITYFGFSPFWLAMRESFATAVADRGSRFFGIEHQTAMLLGTIAVHVGRVRSRRASEASLKHRAMWIGTVVFFVLALWAIPWPWREVGRPWLRGVF